MRTPKFSVYPHDTGKGRRKWRILIPASLSANGKRTPIYYDTKADAESEAAQLRARLAGGKMEAADMLPQSVLKDARAALLHLRENGLEHLSLLEAVKLATAQELARARALNVEATLNAYAEEVAVARNWSKKTRSTWRQYSRKLIGAFGDRNMADVSASDLRAFFSENYSSSPTAYNSAVAVLAGAFTWAVKHEMLDKNPFELIDKRQAAPKDGIDIFTPEEARRLLDACRSYKDAASNPMRDDHGKCDPIYLLDCTDALLPFAVLLFAGIRPDELPRLTWDDIRTEHDGRMFIHVSPNAAKTRQIRFVRVRDTLAAFLSTIEEERRTGKLTPTNWKRKAALVRKAAGLQNRADAPRHSFASYSLALDGDINALRMDMGHTKGSDMLFQHYRAAATPAQAAEYWAIRPNF